METVEETIETNDETEVETSENKETETEVKTPTEDEESEEVIVTIGEEDSPPQQEKTPQWVKDLRQEQRRLKRENKELKQKLEGDSVENMPTAPKKPTFEEANYDDAKFDSMMDDYVTKKLEFEKYQDDIKSKQLQEQKTWESKLNNYAEKRDNLKVSNYEDAEITVQETLSETQQGIILQYADDPAKVVYALGNNPDKAKELANIQDPMQFGMIMKDIERSLSVRPKRKPATPAEKTISGDGSLSGVTDTTLERLRKEADKTGDYSKVYEHKKKLKQG